MKSDVRFKTVQMWSREVSGSKPEVGGGGRGRDWSRKLHQMLCFSPLDTVQRGGREPTAAAH